MHVDEDIVKAAAYGGAVLGGGGGGAIEEGLSLGEAALESGSPRLVTLDEINDQAVLVTVSGVGAPAAAEAYLEPEHYVQALQLLMDHLDEPVSGLIANENGGMATLNGWLQSAVTGLPVVDAPCNGRAHPTGLMGAMGLDGVAGYVSRQTAVGGDPITGRHVRLCVEGSLPSAARLVRQAAVEAGGLVGVARNPVPAAYVRQNGAPGALRQAISVGQSLLAAGGPLEAAEAVCRVLQGEVICQAGVTDLTLRTEGGFDVGQVELEGGFELTFWNEYMTLERQGGRLATFPDLITTFSASEPRPLSSAEIREGQQVLVVRVPHQHLILGGGMRQPELFYPAEKATGKELIRYVFPS
jgi:DUF917 family protein